MPIYEYFCPKCNLKFELLRPLSQVNEDAPCPNCNSRAKRVISGSANYAGSWALGSAEREQFRKWGMA